MGSFSVSCGISSLAIAEEDSVGFIILDTPKETERSLRNGISATGCGTISYIDNTELYMPFLPPVFGTYGGAGDILEIADSPTTAVLEDIFQRPIQEIIECISCEREIYSDFSEIYKSYFSKGLKFNKWGSTEQEELESLGFEKLSGEDEADAYLLADEDIILIKDVDTWVIKNNQNDHLYSTSVNNDEPLSLLMSEFGETTGVYPGFRKDDYNAIKLLHRLSGMFFLEEIYTMMHSHHNDSSRLKTNPYSVNNGKYSQGWSDLYDFFEKNDKDAPVSFAFYELMRFLANNNSLPTNYYKLLLHYKGTDAFESLADMFEIMNSVNKMFMPTYSGDQDGNNGASLALAKASEAILLNRQEDEE